MLHTEYGILWQRTQVRHGHMHVMSGRGYAPCAVGRSNTIRGGAEGA
jgi:hypothetical protein